MATKKNTTAPKAVEQPKAEETKPEIRRTPGDGSRMLSAEEIEELKREGKL